MNPRNEKQTYKVERISTTPPLDGRIHGIWNEVPWTKEFIDIRGTDFPSPRYQTRVKMLRNDTHIFFAAELIEPHIWTTISEKNSVIYWQNDFEIFIDPDNDGLNYYEFEINALNTIWELTLDKPYNKGGSATHPTNIPGLISNVYIDGTINDPSDVDNMWSVVVSIPFSGLEKFVLLNLDMEAVPQTRVTSGPSTFRVSNGSIE